MFILNYARNFIKKTTNSPKTIGKSEKIKIQRASFLKEKLSSFILFFTHNPHHLFQNFRQIEFARVNRNGIFGNHQRGIGA